MYIQFFLPQKANSFLRCQYSSKRKYSLKEGNLALARLDERTDDERECSSERESEDTTELGNESVVIAEKGDSEEDKETQRIEEEEVDDYFPTDICK